MNEACPERITQARELAGLSKTDLGNLLDVSPAAVAQWENGTKHPIAEHLSVMAQVLRIPMTLLFKPMPQALNVKGPVTFRAWRTANSRRNNKKAGALAGIVAEAYLWLEEHVTLPKVDLPDVASAQSPEEAAKICRRSWGLGDRPILKIGELLESKGIIITRASFRDNRFDAFSCVVNGRPMIFLGNEKEDNARSHFDACHELAHLLLHQHLTEQDLRQAETLSRVEQEANAFAGEFLLPSASFAKDVFVPSLDGFLKLKPKWGVSVQAMVKQANRIGVVSAERYQALCRQIAMNGWRKAKGEPLDDLITPVRISLGKKSLAVLEQHEQVHVWEIPDMLPFPIEILGTVFQVGPQDFEPNAFSKIIPLPKGLFTEGTPSG